MYKDKLHAVRGYFAAPHTLYNFQGCSSPLVVKFADTQKEKDQKRIQQLQSNLWNIAGVNITPHYLTVRMLNILQRKLFGRYQRFHLYGEGEYLSRLYRLSVLYSYALSSPRLSARRSQFRYVKYI